ncbi:hypothetical protein CLU96_1271 [Chryseobacterium sp. 52]|uniref:hypothetical protein n=1 Tax=Chryseobacterium sp. 52 TaxID=2035213 RepID=UPI000C1A3500|nr:hypothetical protein [Chryseobacterium sp. 52]PIF44328.1 hypothetical protein CLU96_1271 [Chryseobacterium sp. 52]
MKVKELNLKQEVIINGFNYEFKGVNKIRMPGHWEQKILFKSLGKHPDKHFDLHVGNAEVKDLKIEIVAT